MRTRNLAYLSRVGMALALLWSPGCDLEPMERGDGERDAATQDSGVQGADRDLGRPPRHDAGAGLDAASDGGEPLDALREAARLTRPGGVVYVTDVDDDLIVMDPPVEAFDNLKAVSAEAQARHRGDRRIGRRLPRLFQQAGLSRVSATVGTVTSLQLGWEAFFELAVGFRSILLGREGEGRIRALRAELADVPPRPFGSARVFSVRGVA